MRVSEPTATLKAGAKERAATSSRPTTYAVKKPAAGTAPKAKPTATSKAKKSAAGHSAGDEAARALGRGLGSMGKMFGSFKDEFDKASK